MLIRLFCNLFIMLSCTAYAQEEHGTTEVKIQVSQIALDKWEVKYSLKEKIPAVAFLRQRNKFREKYWKVKSKNLELAIVNDLEVIKSKDGSGFDEIVIQHEFFKAHLPKDYYMFFGLSDKSALLYTGHYNIEPLIKDKKGFAQQKLRTIKTVFTFTPLKKQNVVVSGKTSGTHLLWTDKDNDGTYAYFGKIKAIENGYSTALIDPAVPKWIVNNVNEFLPKLFKYYTDHLKRPLNYKPTIFLTYSEPQKSGFGNKGGTLTQAIQLDLIGKKYVSESREAKIKLVKFLAHEAAHLWNGQMFQSDGAPWMHEGGADAFAYRALLDLKLISRVTYLNFLEEAANKCADGLKLANLTNSGDKGYWKNYYHCGSTIALATEAVWKPRSVFQFWDSLFLNAKKNKGTYTASHYLSLLKDSKKGKELANYISKVINEQQSKPEQLIFNMLQRTGINVSWGNNNLIKVK